MKRDEVPEELTRMLWSPGDGGEPEFHPDMWWWNFDQYVSGLIADAAKRLREDGHGYPGDMTVEKWHAYLTKVETPLRVWAEQKFDGVGKYEFLDAQAAMHAFAERFGGWWD